MGKVLDSYLGGHYRGPLLRSCGVEGRRCKLADGDESESRMAEKDIGGLSQGQSLVTGCGLLQGHTNFKDTIHDRLATLNVEVSQLAIHRQKGKEQSRKSLPESMKTIQHLGKTLLEQIGHHRDHEDPIRVDLLPYAYLNCDWELWRGALLAQVISWVFFSPLVASVQSDVFCAQISANAIHEACATRMSCCSRLGESHVLCS